MEPGWSNLVNFRLQLAQPFRNCCKELADVAPGLTEYPIYPTRKLQVAKKHSLQKRGSDHCLILPQAVSRAGQGRIGEGSQLKRKKTFGLLLLTPEAPALLLAFMYPLSSSAGQKNSGG